MSWQQQVQHVSNLPRKAGFSQVYWRLYAALEDGNIYAKRETDPINYMVKSWTDIVLCKPRPLPVFFNSVV